MTGRRFTHSHNDPYIREGWCAVCKKDCQGAEMVYSRYCTTACYNKYMRDRQPAKKYRDYDKILARRARRKKSK